MEQSLQEAIKKSTVILPEHHGALISCLEEFPDGLEKWLYSPSVIDAQSLYQADIITNVPVCLINESGNPIRGIDIVCLISATCDMQAGRKEFIVAAPIVLLSEYVAAAPDSDQARRTIDEISKNSILSFFYLPEYNHLPQSFIDFTRMVSISSRYLNQIKQYSPAQCILSFSRTGYYLFLIKLTYYLARMEPSDSLRSSS